MVLKRLCQRLSSVSGFINLISFVQEFQFDKSCQSLLIFYQKNACFHFFTPLTVLSILCVAAAGKLTSHILRKISGFVQDRIGLLSLFFSLK